MNIKASVTIICGLFTAHAFAISLSNQNCFKDSVRQQISNISGMIELASLSEHDNRDSITNKAGEVGFTAHDVDHIRAAHGFVYCPGSYTLAEVEANKKIKGKLPLPRNGALLSATIIGADDQIVTNAHAFIDPITGKPRDPLSKCAFQNQSIPHVRRSLLLKDGQAGIDQAVAMGLLKIGNISSGSNYDDNYDMAVAKLASPIPGVKAFKISSQDMRLHGCDGTMSCQQIVVVSSSQKRMPKPVSLNEPIVQSCLIRSVYGSGNGAGSSFLSDCSSTQGASASLNFLKDKNGQFVRDSDGELLPIAILSSANGGEDMDHKPFNITSGMATKSLVLDGDAAASIMSMADSGSQRSRGSPFEQKSRSK